MSGWRMQEFLCEKHGRFESLERAPVPESVPCPTCARAAPAVISAVASKTCWASAGPKGKPDPAPRPTATDTIPLGEGQTYNEWKANRRKVWRDHDRKKRRDRGAPIR
jgi:hypothetical protein